MAEDVNNAQNNEQPNDSQHNVPDVDYKQLYEKLSEDNAKLSKYNKDLKDKYQAKLTEEEKQKAQVEEREAYYKSLEKELSISKYKQSLSSRVSSEKDLTEMANKLAEGNIFEALDMLSKYESEKEKGLRSTIQKELMANNPTPPPTNTNDGNTTSQKDFDKMSYKERVALKEKDPTLYEKLANN